MAEMKNILIVDDEVDFARGLARMVGQAYPDLVVDVAHTGMAALALADTYNIQVMLLDMNMPGMHGMDVLSELHTRHPNIVVVVLTAYGTVETAVSAIKQGAWDFIGKPVKREDLLLTLAKALQHSSLKGENQRLKQIMASSGMERKLAGDSPAMRKLRETIAAVASSSYTVLIRGESGTGKELVAEAVHSISLRKDKPFIKVNCPAIPEPLLESELFGHVKGAFTGATSNHKGMFVQAAGGTLLLDEIGDLPMGVQAKLLRVLQDGEVRPVGSNTAARVDTRIVAATNQDLEAKIKSGEFREDLFYRLNVLTIQIPPLRERKEDISILASLFFVQSCAELGIEEKMLSPAAVAALCQHDWPGNVRELQNFIRRQAVFSAGSHSNIVNLLPEHDDLTPEQDAEDGVLSYEDAKNNLLDTFTRNYMREILSRTGGNISESARISGLERVSLQKILRRLDMKGADFRK